ncbi:hypothetical protein M440DRAFT_1398012 [Trichoderma longibrachiatum ATCC 18648]|uniref:Uncharacterized protein n=1 Tax=Trichoderma longibrachiatum ATCC 18648 TaxID=983965 RepID=A0A2T4CGG5_TRILO|nr:hypothetical protein M440DRAFT_1398012 [Trichoderma longibrachiatum ATCC 18648]
METKFPVPVRSFLLYMLLLPRAVALFQVYSLLNTAQLPKLQRSSPLTIRRVHFSQSGLFDSSSLDILRLEIFASFALWNR